MGEGIGPFFFASASLSFDFCCVPGGYMRAQLWAGAQNRCHVVGTFPSPSGTHPVQAAAGCIPCVGDVVCPTVLMVSL